MRCEGAGNLCQSFDILITPHTPPCQTSPVLPRNGAVEARNCSVAPNAQLSSPSTARVLSYPLPRAGLVVYVCPTGGSDTNAGTQSSPLRSLDRALTFVRKSRASAKGASAAETATLVL